SWLTLALVSLPPLIAPPFRGYVFLYPSDFTEVTGVSPSLPLYKGDGWPETYKFSGQVDQSLLTKQVVWVFYDKPATDQPGVVLTSGAIVTLGFPVGALVGREMLWDYHFRKTLGEVNLWRYALRIMRTPPSLIGFPVDSAFWASAYLVLMATPASITHIRRVRRVRRGACPDCGYPRKSGSDQCSECGAGGATSVVGTERSPR
ncbi:MAG: zinc ribbon domain-containing protein, partial [Planctomycetota bacterium]|nr:zinc ribbon domain-containing protein [Planctomycetota bacterium]